MNTIAERIADFLKNHSPFNNLTFNELYQISLNIRVINLDKNQTLFQINDSLHECFYVVASGVINLSVISDAEESLLGKCPKGSIFGLRPFFAKNNYMVTSKAREESIVYAIPIETFKPFVTNNSLVLNFLLESFAATSSNKSSKDDSTSKIISDNLFYHDQQADTQYFQTLRYDKSPVKASLKAIIKDIAVQMNDNMTSSVFICEKDCPIGIVTDRDMRSKVATGRYLITDFVDKIMDSPVVTVPENISLAEAQLLMLNHSVSYLCVTQDGTAQSVVKGVISEHDLIIAQASNPGVMIKEIKRSLEVKDLKQIRERLTDLIQNAITKNVSVHHISTIASEINLAIIKRSIELSILELGSPPARFVWLSIGSQGRKEQLLLTDQDSMLVFEDVAGEKYRDVKDYFMKLSKKTIATLEKVGFPLCKHNHMASNLQWCKSLTDWIKEYNSWMNTPRENTHDMSTVFFDYEFVFGDNKLEETIKNVVLQNTKDNSLFFDFLGNDVLKYNAPLTFFKKFALEEEGEHRNTFDVKNRALMPLINGARLFALHHNLKGINNTYLRFKQLAIVDSKNEEVYLNCAEAFITLSRFRTYEGLKNDNSGQYIFTSDMPKLEKEKLKAAFGPMEELEELIKAKFKLTQFS